MKGDLKIYEISKDTITDSCAKYCVEERNEVYYLACANEPEKPISVLWSNLNWLRRHFSIERFNENAKITRESLNISRKAQIVRLKECIKHNIHERSHEYLQPDGTFGMIENPRYLKMNIDGIGIDDRKEIPREPIPLTKEKKEEYLKEINKGLYIICKYV